MRAPSSMCRALSGVVSKVVSVADMGVNSGKGNPNPERPHGCARPVLPPLSALPERFAGPAYTVLLHCVQTAGCSFGGLHRACGGCNLSPVGCRWWPGRQRLSVLLPERSDRCNQRSCAFGGLFCKKLSPDGLQF